MTDRFRPARTGLLAAALAAAACVSTLSAQPRRARLESPTVSADRRIHFQVAAPDAQTLRLQAPWAGENVEFERAESGIWSLTVGPVPPAIYSYTLLLDGVRVLDPHNTAVKRWSGGNASLVEVPAPEPAAYDLRDVPHGSLHTHYYASAAGGANRRLVVYTPPGYYEEADRRYPVLYLLHGSGDDETAWAEVGKANLILDNLIASGAAEPMLVVMPNGHPVPWASRRRGIGSDNTQRFRDDLIEGAMPLVQSLYRAKLGPSQTAVAGLSMGGGQSLYCAATGLDHFSWVGAFSAAAPSPDSDGAQGLLADPERANARLDLLWIAIGRDDFLLDRNQAFQAALVKAGVDHIYRVTAGGHSWPVWRGYLAEFAPLLFRAASKP
ncbi:MAG: alpha/beta hydrolase-fold protein [Bryobacterales bacterium]|nr:alpha/beta hydrolase-fold protein [Bryobacterales bacterium]